MASMTPQKRAAKTRAQQKAARDLYETVTKPAHAKVEAILRPLLHASNVRLCFVGPNRLKGGVTGARLLDIGFGGLQFTVQIDGYKKPQTYASSFWELEGGN